VSGKWGKLKERGRERLSFTNAGLLFSSTCCSLRCSVKHPPCPLSLLIALPDPSLFLSSTSSVALLSRQQHARAARRRVQTDWHRFQTLSRLSHSHAASCEASPAVNNRIWRRGVVSKERRKGMKAKSHTYEDSEECGRRGGTS
jgi:hypothetical protein